MTALDTTSTAAAIQEEAHRQLGAGGRLRAALELSDLTHALAVSGLRRRRPALTEDEAYRELAVVLYGPQKS